MKTSLKIFALVLFALITVSVTSCKKDKKTGSSGPPGGTTGKECILSMINLVYEEICNGDVYGGSEEIVITYDNDGRISKWDFGGDEFYQFIYGADGKLHKTEDHWEGDVDYILFTWNGNKVKRQYYWDYGGVYEPSHYYEILELNSNNEIIRADGYMVYGEDDFHAWYDIYTWSNGNVVQIEEYYNQTWKQSLKNLKTEINRKSIFRGKKQNEKPEMPVITDSKNRNFALAYKSTFTYDNKKNPFFNMTALKLTWFDDPLILSKNNLVSVTEIEYENGSTNSYTFTVELTYNDDGYPKTLILDEGDDGDCYWTEYIELNYSNCD